MKVVALVLAALLASSSVSSSVRAQSSSSASSSSSLRRLVLLISADDGGFGRPRLRWTGDDARAVGAVLTELGGVQAGDVVHVDARNDGDVERALVGVDDALQKAHADGARVELIVYYSGHSDIDGLLVGSDRLPWSTLRRRIDEMSADVRVVIIDSCSSGALVREKGGRHRPPFAMSDAGGVRGHAFLTSSRDDEPAQESDRVRGSFFTHALVTGLRGAADATGDGLVTLNEAYQFAFSETLAHTELAAGGTQHPAYDIQLAGSGEWIVTDLRDSSAGVVLAADVVGRVLLRDERGRLVAELQKGPTEIVLGVPAGRYDVRLLTPGSARTTSISVDSGARVVVAADQLQEAPMIAATARGGDVDDDHISPVANVALLPPVESNAIVEGGAHNAFGFHVLAGSQRRLTGLNLGIGLNITTEDLLGLDIAGVGNVVAGHARGALIGGVGNVVATDLEGVGVGGVVNLVGSANGALVGGVTNVVAVDHRGVGLSGVGNVVGGASLGGQFAGAFNWTTQGFTGTQIAGAFNVGGHSSLGLALAPFNAHERLTGAQLGVINIGGDVVGTQIGVINIANSVSGAQVGVVNVAAHSDVSVGLLSFIGDGIHSVGVIGSELFPLGAVARLGSARVYGVFELNWSPVLEDNHHIVSLRAGPGVRFPFSLGGHDLALDIEAVGGSLHRTDDLLTSGLHLATTARALLHWRPVPMVDLSAGPAVNVLVVDGSRTFNVPLTVLRFDSAADTIIAPGIAVGVAF